MRTLLFCCAVAAVCAGKVSVSEVSVGEHKGKAAAGAGYSERSAFALSVDVAHEGKAVAEMEMAAVRFTHVETGRQVWFPLAAGSGNTWSAEVDMVRHAEQSFYFVAGKYTVAFIISDSSFSNQVEHDAGSLDMKLTPTPLFLQKLEFGEEKDWVRRAPQAWDIRPAEQQGSAVASTFFSAALGFPVLVLFALLFNAGVNFSGLFENKVTFVRSVIFHGCLCAICAFIVMYWIHVPLFPTMMMIGGTGVVALVFRPKASAVSKSKKE